MHSPVVALGLALGLGTSFSARPPKSASSGGPRNHFPRTHELYTVGLPWLSFHHNKGQGQLEFS